MNTPIIVANPSRAGLEQVWVHEPHDFHIYRSWARSGRARTSHILTQTTCKPEANGQATGCLSCSAYGYVGRIVSFLFRSHFRTCRSESHLHRQLLGATIFIAVPKGPISSRWASNTNVCAHELLKNSWGRVVSQRPLAGAPPWSQIRIRTLAPPIVLGTD